MKKKIIIVSILCVLCIGLISGILFLDNNNVVLENEKIKKSKNNNQISMMFETAKDSNVYEVSSDNTFPISEYIFNETLSKCENGGIISWDQDNQKAVVRNNISDKCYAYFDRYDMPKITNVGVEYSTNNITIDIEAVAGTNAISKYYYYIENSEVLASNTPNINYVIDSKYEGKTINLTLYAVDSKNYKSNLYKTQINIPKVLDDIIVNDDMSLAINELSYINNITFVGDGVLTINGGSELIVSNVVSNDGSSSDENYSNAKSINLNLKSTKMTVTKIQSGNGGNIVGINGTSATSSGRDGSDATLDATGGNGGKIIITIDKYSTVNIESMISGSGGNGTGGAGGNGARGHNGSSGASSTVRTGGPGGAGGNGSNGLGGNGGDIVITNSGYLHISQISTGSGGVGNGGSGGAGGAAGAHYSGNSSHGRSYGGAGGNGGNGKGGNGGSIDITSTGKYIFNSKTIGLYGNAVAGSAGSGGTGDVRGSAGTAGSATNGISGSDNS